MRTIDNPLADKLRALGGILEPLANVGGQKHSETAISFGDVDGELDALRRGVGLVDLSARGLLVITGEERAAWLHGLCTQDIKAMGSGQGGYACHVDIKGRIQADMRVGVFDEMILMDMEPGLAAPLRRQLKRFIVMEKVGIVDRSGESGAIGVAGPGAAALIAELCGEDLSGLPTHHLRAVALGDEDAIVAATDQLGAPGYRIAVSRAGLGATFDRLLGAGGGACRPVGWQAVEVARVGAGLARFGPELGPEVLFNEAGLATAVSFTKGCYLGQEIVERVDARGRVGRRLMGLRLDAQPGALPEPGSLITNEARKLGVLTSVAWVEGRALALGFIHRDDNEPGARLQIVPEEGAGGAPCHALVVERDQLGAS